MTDRDFFNAVWDVLVTEAGASKDPHERICFVRAYTDLEHPATEFRFCGVLGFGGKFWRNAGRFYVTCYPEDRTAARQAVVARVNAKITDLLEANTS